MKQRICFLVFVVLAMVLSPAMGHALPDEQGEYEKLGVGNLECGLWTQARQSGDMYAVWWKTLILGWVQGFLTAHNLYGPGTPHSGSDAYSVGGWVDDYCRQHPVDSIAGAAETLVEDLQKHRKTGLPR
jgi:hypothetical protein